ncbi:MAG TPA: alpha/beta fold hydrolase [Drouetiella sp.]
MSKELVSIPLPETMPFAQSRAEHEVRWINGSDGQPLACRVYPAVGQNPVLIYLHGIEGHSQWFQHTAARLNSKGIGIYACDRRGSGLNMSNRGHVSNKKVLLADIEIILRTVAIENTGRPIFMFGNCWGGKPACNICRDDYETTDGKALPPVAGLILTSPAIFTKVDLNLRSKLDIAWSIARGGTHGEQHIKIPIESYMFTNDPTYLEFIEQDPLRIVLATKRFYFEQFFITLNAKFAQKHLQLPILLLESGEDHIVNLPALNNWFDQLASRDKTKVMFENAAHSLDFDPACFDEYCQTLMKWLAQHSPGMVA